MHSIGTVGRIKQNEAYLSGNIFYIFVPKSYSDIYIYIIYVYYVTLL